MHPHLVVKKKGKFALFFFFRKITVTIFFISIFSISFFSKSERNDCHLFYYQKKVHCLLLLYQMFLLIDHTVIAYAKSPFGYFFLLNFLKIFNINLDKYLRILYTILASHASTGNSANSYSSVRNASRF